MIVYPDRDTITQRTRQQVPIMHTDVSTYAQTLMNFQEANPVPTNSSNKRLKIRLNEDTMSSKRNSTIKDSTPHLPPHEKTITFIDIDGLTPAETAAADEHSNTQTKRLHSTTETTRDRSTFG